MNIVRQCQFCTTTTQPLMTIALQVYANKTVKMGKGVVICERCLGAAIPGKTNGMDAELGSAVAARATAVYNSILSHPAEVSA